MRCVKALHAFRQDRRGKTWLMLNPRFLWGFLVSWRRRSAYVGGFEMQTPSPSVQSGTEAVPSVEQPASPDPVFEGPAPALWTGAITALLVFVIIIMLIIRGRVVRPAQRRTAARADFFEPAGEDAEITFDDEFHEQTPSEEEHRHHDEMEAEVTISPAEEEAGDFVEEAGEEAPEQPVSPPKRSRFAGLFARNKETQREPHPPHDELSEGVFETAPEEEHWLSGTQAFNDTEDAAADNLHADVEEEDARRREAERLDAEITRRLAEEEANRQREAEERRQQLLAAEAADRPAEPPQALQPPGRPQQDMLGATDKMRARASLEERFAALSTELHAKLDEVSAPPARDDSEAGVSEAHFAEFADLIGEQIVSLRESVNAHLEQLKRRIDALAGAPDGAAGLAEQIANLNRILGERPAGATAARIQLSDLLNDALPPERYALKRKLSNNKTADGCVETPGLQKPIAIDANFPVEAFDDYLRRRVDPNQDIKAENEFRRVILRHIVDIAEKLIVPGETADCAMLFVPSEHILSELHSSFPDLVQESYRARVWMVSPTSLMATLHTISAIIRDAGATPPPSAEESALHNEMEMLRHRIEALESARDKNAAAADPALWENGGGEQAVGGRLSFHEAESEDRRANKTNESADLSYRSLSPEEEAFERLEREEAATETAGENQDSEIENRPPFPLR